MHNKIFTQAEIRAIVNKGAKIRNRYNQVPQLTQDTNGKVTNSQLDTTNESQEVSPFPAGDHKAHINRHVQRHSKHKTEKHKDPQRSTALERSVKYFTGGFKPGLTVNQPHHKSLSRTVKESEVRPSGVQLKRKAKLPTVIGLTTKHAVCCNTLML